MKIVQKPGGSGAPLFALRRGAGLLLLIVLPSLALLPACSSNNAQGNTVKPAARPPVPVMVAVATEETVPVQLDVIGTGEAYSTVSVKSLVQGEVQRAYFRQGQYVEKGQTLYSIDPAPFEAALAQAQASVAKDQAQLQYAEAQNQRYTDLYKQGIVSQDQYDQYHSTAAQLEAALRADQAAVRNAQIQLGYCTIRSPLEGLTGAFQVDQGNLVKVNDVPMVVINQIKPIYVDFSVPQQYLQQIKEYQAVKPLRVEAVIPHEPDRPEWGALSFINNTVDTSTGTILLKGAFPNPQRRLWPGEFVNVILNLSSQANAVVAPSPAIQTGQKGQFVYVVQADHTVALLPVTTGSVYKGNMVIEKGLKAGETVVTDGQLMLYPGAKVEIKSSL
ncbi:MAG: efflux RND transporter periplasmic adaptor subunit [Terriglobia bacterium]